MAEYAKPLPDITAESKPFWDACARHELLVQTCRACGNVQYYPRGVCAACWSAEIDWRPRVFNVAMKLLCWPASAAIKV